MAKRLILVLVSILAMAQAASAQFGGAVRLADNSGFQLADAAKTLDGATQGGGPTAALNQQIQTEAKRQESTMKGLADAAKQLDATTTSGGPTAAQNQ